MAKSYACADTDDDCPGAFTTETEAELWKHLELHAEEAHPDFEWTPESRELVTAVIKTV